MKVSELMNKDLVVSFGGDTVQKAAEDMAKYHRGLLPVFNNEEEKKVIGVLSNKDIIEKVIAKGKSPNKIFVSDIMMKNVISLTPDDETSKAMSLMRKYGVKRILVINNDVLQGIISSNDILDGMIRYKKKLLEMAIDF